MVRRSWRNFDYLLLGALLLLSAYGVIMIYSATINTPGIEDAVRRQIIYVAVGATLLLITASVDYRLLEIVQHPLSILTPLVLALGNIGLVIIWQTGQMPVAGVVPTAALFKPDLPVMVMGVALVSAVFLVDRAWIEKLDLALTRAVLAVVVIGAAAAAAFGLNRFGSESLPGLTPYLMVGAVAVIYLLDCLTLRFGDVLRDPVYVLMLGVLGVILVIGQVSGGSQRWLGAGSVQPSELSKILVIIVLAKFLAEHEEEMDKFGTVLVSLGILAVPVLLIYLQPDLGTGLALIAIGVAMMWTARIRFRHLLVLVGGAVAALPLVWLSLKDYMRQRLMLFINPAGDPDSYFNVHQALVSIGSGGWMGKGLTHGTQSQLHFLRVRHTDFIFAVTAEELGFLGAVAMILLIFFLLWRIVRVAEQARDTFGRLIAAGVAGLILFQSVVNIGMNLGLMPVTGIPLPFVSYGGSSFLTLMLGMGLVESVAMRHKKLEFD
jgi:rod shape determining protein RodA